MADRKHKSRFRDKVAGNAKQQKNKASSFGYLNLPKGFNLFKEEPGARIRLDFLPYTVTDQHHPDRDDETEIAVPGSEWYKRPFKVHANIGSNNNMVVCPSSIGKKCPICQHRAKLLSDGANWQDDAVKQLRARERNLYIVVPIGEKKYDEVPHIWDISQFLFQDKLNDELEENDEHGIFPDPEEGLTLRIRFSEETLGKNVFADTSRIDFEERDKPYSQKVISGLPSLDDILIIKDYDTIDRMFKEMDSGTEPDDDDPPRTRRRRSIKDDDEDKPRSKPRLVGDDEEADERTRRRRQAIDNGDDDEEEERPRQRRRRSVRNDDEEDDEDDAEADERPRRGRRQAIIDEEPPRRLSEPEDEAAEPTNTKMTRRTRNTNNSDGNDQECPHGYRFGHDCDEYDECVKCKVWDACMQQWDVIHAK